MSLLKILELSPFKCHICSSFLQIDARGNYFAVSDSLKWRSFPVSACHPARVRVKCRLSMLPALSQCQSHGGCWNLIVNRPLRWPLKQVKPLCFTAGRKLPLTSAAHHSHYHADDLNVFVLNELLLFSRQFWYVSQHLLPRSKYLLLKIQDLILRIRQTRNSFQPLWSRLQSPSPLISLRSAQAVYWCFQMEDIMINTILQGKVQQRNTSHNSENKAAANRADMGMRT